MAEHRTTDTPTYPHGAPAAPRGFVDAPWPQGTDWPQRFDPWRAQDTHRTLAEIAGRDLRLAFTLDSGGLYKGRLNLSAIADFFLQGKGWRRTDHDGYSLWEGPNHVPPTWMIGRPSPTGWTCHPSLLLDDWNEPAWDGARRTLLDTLDQLRVVGTRAQVLDGAVLPWWLLPNHPPADTAPTTQAIARIEAAATAFTAHLHHTHTGPWLHMDPQTVVDGVPTWPAKVWRVARDPEGRFFFDKGDTAQAQAIAGPALDGLWRDGTHRPHAFDRITLPQCPSIRNVAWAWELPNPSSASAHTRLARVGVWRKAAAAGTPSSQGTPVQPPPGPTPFGLPILAAGDGGRHSALEKAERALAAGVREGRVTSDNGAILAAGHQDCDRAHALAPDLRLWTWDAMSGPRVGLLGWKDPAHPQLWRIHPGLLRLPDTNPTLDIELVRAHGEMWPATVARGTLKHGQMLPWWALGAEEPVLGDAADTAWSVLRMAIQAFLIEEEDFDARITLCPPQMRDHTLVWAHPILHRAGPTDAHHTRFQRVLLPLAERFLHQPTCGLLPGHVARAVWRMVGAPNPFPEAVMHPNGPVSAHAKLSMAVTWDGFQRRRW